MGSLTAVIPREWGQRLRYIRGNMGTCLPNDSRSQARVEPNVMGMGCMGMGTMSRGWGGDGVVSSSPCPSLVLISLSQDIEPVGG